MNSVDVGLDSRAVLDILNNPLQSQKETALDQLRDFSNWLIFFPMVIVLIFICAQFGLLLKYRFAFPEPDPNLYAEYAPWSYLLIHSINPDIIKEIKLDRSDVNKSTFQNPQKITSSWVYRDSETQTNPIPATETSLPAKNTHTPQPTSTQTLTPTATNSPTPTDTQIPTTSATPTGTQLPATSITPTSTPSPTVTPTFTPSATATPSATPTPGNEHVGLGTYGVYKSESTLIPSQGTITVWLNFLVGHSRSDHMVIHSDDSRWVLYIDTFKSDGLNRDILAIVARAGGNKIASTDDGSRRGYPEARLLVDNDGYLREIGYGASESWIGVEAFPEGEWHHIAMSWAGYPSGIVKLYLDGQFMSSLQYDSKYDDGRPLIQMFSFGFKPYPWPGVVDLPVYEDVGSGRLESGGIEANGLRIYDEVLSQAELNHIFIAGIDN